MGKKILNEKDTKRRENRNQNQLRAIYNKTLGEKYAEPSYRSALATCHPLNLTGYKSFLNQIFQTNLSFYDLIWSSDFNILSQKIHEFVHLTKHNDYLSQFSSEDFSNINEVDLPFDNDLNTSKSVKRLLKERYTLETEKSKKIRQFAIDQNSTCYAVFLTAYLMVLRKLSGQKNLAIGLMELGRLDLIFSLDDKHTIKTILQYVTKRSCDFMEHKTKRHVENEQRRSNISFGFQSYVFENDPYELLGNDTKSYSTVVDLHLEVLLKPNNVSLELIYNGQKYCHSQIDKIYEYIGNVMDFLITEEDSCFVDIEIISDQEKFKILDKFNNTDADFVKDETIIHQFERVAKKIPERRAILFEGKSMSFGELSNFSNRLSVYLIKNHCIRTGDIVIVCMDRSIYLIPTILGLMKAGAVYLPVTTSTPVERFKRLIVDSKAKLIIRDSDNVFFKTKTTCQLLNIEQSLKNILAEDNSPINPLPNRKDLAYIIYTSGSTGNPKGVMIEHQALSNRINWMQSKYPITSSDTLLQKTPLSFDVSIWELFWWMRSGASLVLLPSGAEKEPTQIAKYIDKQEITVIHFVPSMLSAFLQSIKHYDNQNLESLRLVFSSGEALKVSHLREFRKSLHQSSGTRLINLYGPTEATVDVSYYECKFDDDEELIPIGKPINNIKLFVLDIDNQLAPIGVKGQLGISGIGLARGYLNQKELTADKFVELRLGDKLFRTYLTGDMAKWSLDGNIIYLGRTDNQVKIRGYRIELGEIENQMQIHPSVLEASVVVINIGGNSLLKGYYVAESSIREEDLKCFLSDRLPDYMVPYRLYQIKEMPLTENGKCDKKQLMSITKEKKNIVSYELDDITERLIVIWSDILRIPKKDVKDNGNFFELGGHSLIAVQIIARIFAEFDVNFTFAEFFKQYHITDLANIIRKKRNDHSPSQIILPVFYKTGQYPLSYSQGRMWAQSKIESDSSFNNMVRGYRLFGKFHPFEFKKACEFVVSRHDSLRTVFPTLNGIPFQKIISFVDYELSFGFDDLREHAGKEIVAIEEQQKYVNYHFDLENGPLMVIKLIQLRDQEFVLLLTMHHIISDGWSMGVFFRELTQFYGRLIKGEIIQNEELTIQYKDYAVASEKLILEHKEYWNIQFSGTLTYLELPTDFARQDLRTYNGKALQFQFSKTLVASIKRTSREHYVSPFVILLSAYYILLYKYSGQSDLIIGTPSAGRFLISLENQIGLFLNTLALRVCFNSTIKIQELFRIVNKTVIDASEHQIYPFDLLIKDIAIERKPNRSPLFDIGISWQSHEERDSKIEGIEIEQLEQNEIFTPHDLWLIGAPHDEDATFEFSFIYNIALFKPETIEKLKTDYCEIVMKLTTDPSITVDDVFMGMLQQSQTLNYSTQQLSDEF